MRTVGAPVLVLAATAVLSAAVGAAPGGGGRIVFVRVGVGVVTVDSLGGNQQLVVRMSASAPRWSPDGRRLAFAATSAAGGGSRIYVVASDGSGLRALTSPPRGANDSDPDWSPDGTHIVFDRRTPSPIVTPPPPAPLGPQLLLMDADGTNLRTLGTGRSPAWSPDGRAIAFVLDRSVGPASLRWVSLMRSDGTGRRRLTRSASQTEDNPDWSPDGRRVVYADAGRIQVVARGGGEPSQLTAGTLPDDDPSWSPDGTRIVFVRNFLTKGAPAHRLVVMRADGRRQRVLVGGRSESFAPDWRAPARS
jgi:TolB protein